MRLLHAPLAACLALALSCSDASPERSHYLRVIVVTDLQAPDDIDQLQITVEREGVALFSGSYPRETIQTLHEHGDALILENPHPSNDSPEKQLLTVKPVEISVLGYREQKVRVARSARLQFNDGHRQLPLALCRSCLDHGECPDGQTCKAGQCQSNAVKAEALPEDGQPVNAWAECGGL